jgi:hypothetical protein
MRAFQFLGFGKGHCRYYCTLADGQVEIMDLPAPARSYHAHWGKSNICILYSSDFDYACQWWQVSTVSDHQCNRDQTAFSSRRPSGIRVPIDTRAVGTESRASEGNLNATSPDLTPRDPESPWIRRALHSKNCNRFGQVQVIR